VPGWSPETLAAFDGLTPLERSFVEWYATGGNAAEAYRQATGSEYTDRHTDSTRNNGYAIRSRPRVRAAIDAAMNDVNFDARMNRQWMLQRLQVALDKAEASSEPGDQATVAKIIKTIAELKGEIVKKSEVEHRGNAERVDIHLRVDSMLAEVSRLVAGRTGRPPIGVGGAGRAVEGRGVGDPVGAERGAASPRLPE
jgi:hypothetical protein